jgi:two-component system chemotaxis response regulator CheB
MSLAVTAASNTTAPAREVIRVMVVDDAVVVRGLLTRWVEAEAGLQMVASLRSGREAIDQLERARPDVCILDVDMPDIDGITALPLLFAKRPDLVVIMSSTLTRRNAEISLRALALGAADYIPKPESTREITTSESFRRDLIEKIRVLGARRRQSLGSSRPLPWAAHRLGPSANVATHAAAHRPARACATASERPSTHAALHAPPHPPHHIHAAASDHAPLKLRSWPSVPPRALLIGASTGGPQALNAVVSGITEVIDHAPVLITQHMPPTFTTILAEILERACERPAHEGVDGEPVRAGRIYIAPGGRHMRVVRRDGQATIALDDGPPINFCKPSVDPMFSSAAEVWGSWNLALILTGMGSDGTRGAGSIVDAGGSVIAQDEDTSVVWGMPGAATRAGLCCAVLPVDQIAGIVVGMFAGVRS